MISRFLPTLIALIIFLLAPVADAAAAEAFDHDGFEKARAAGKPILLEFHAPWCPTCRRQQPIVRELLEKPELSGFEHFVADYDSSRDLQKELGVRRQGTIIVFRGKEEISRSVGITNREELEAQIAKAVN